LTHPVHFITGQASVRRPTEGKYPPNADILPEAGILP